MRIEADVLPHDDANDQRLDARCAGLKSSTDSPNSSTSAAAGTLSTFSSSTENHPLSERCRPLARICQDRRRANFSERGLITGSSGSGGEMDFSARVAMEGVRHVFSSIRRPPVALRSIS